jgi:hypothetical protein
MSDESYSLEYLPVRSPVWGIPRTDRMESIGFGNLGRTFYVHGTLGSDSNDYDGLSSDFPFRTITYALARCTALANDVIVVLYYPSAGATGEVWPININKAGVKLIGGTGLMLPDAVRVIRPPVASGDICAIGVTANDVEIAGLWIELQAGSTHGCIEVPGPGAAGPTYRTKIHHCVFGGQTAARDGIWNPAAANFDAVNLDVYECVFDTYLTRSGIRIDWNSTRGEFHNNFFRLVAGPGIYLAGTAAAVWRVFDNIFSVPDAAPGEAITTIIGTAGCLFYRNIAMEGKVAFANIPWVEGGTGEWALNYSNILLVNPA